MAAQDGDPNIPEPKDPHVTEAGIPDTPDPTPDIPDIPEVPEETPEQYQNRHPKGPF